MRVCFSIVFSVLFLSLNAQGPAEIRVSHSAQSTTIASLFETLEKEYGVRFSYACTDWLKTSIDIDVQDVPLEDLIRDILVDQQIEYKIIANNILLRKASNHETIPSPSYLNSIHLKGRVVMDHDKKDALPFATIAVTDSPIGTYADDNGLFDLEIPEQYADHTLVVSYIGYEDLHYRLSETEDHYVLLAMEEQSVTFEEVMIVNKQKPLKIRPHSSNITVANGRFNTATPGGMSSDINRSIQLLPGITAHDDDSADIKIRGSNSDETLMILDGMPLYNTDHYYGIFSGINAAHIDSVNVYKNSYPVYYGGKAGGLVELFSKNEQPEVLTGSLGIDLLSVQGRVAVPLTASSSVHIAARSTHRMISNQQFNSARKRRNNQTTEIPDFASMIDNNGSDPKFRYHDLNFSYLWRSSDRNTLQLNLYRSSDHLLNSYMIHVKDVAQDELNLRMDERKNWSTTASSILWNRSISQKWQLHTRAYTSIYTNVQKNALRLERRLKRIDKPTLPQLIDNVNIGASQSNDLRDLGFNTDVRYSAGQSSVKIGLQGASQGVDYTFAENENPNITGSQVLRSLGAYASIDHTIGSHTNIKFGLRSTYYDQLNQAYLSPRIYGSHRLTDYMTIKGSYALYQQAIRQLYYEYKSEPRELWVSAGQNGIPVLESENMMVGTTFKAGPLTIDIEAFHKNLKGNVEYAIINPLKVANDPETSEDYALYTGEGRIRGIDIITNYSHNNYDAFISYTYSKNVERYNEILNNRYYPSENDRRHQFKWVNRYSISDWTLDLNAIYTSGRPYTDVVNIGADGDIRNASPMSRLRRLPAYTRMDFVAGRSLNIADQKIDATISIFNIFNRQNVRYIQSVVTQLDNTAGVSTAILGNENALLNRTVNIGISWKF